MPARGATGYMIPSGRGINGVMIVAEALGHHEAQTGTPLVGDAGFMLGQILKRMGLSRDDFTLANILFCRPPNNKLRGEVYEDDAIEHCLPNLQKLIQERQPKVLLAMGAIPFETLTGIRGVESEVFRGYVHRDTKDERWVIGTFHPSWLLRGNWSQCPAVISDIEKALRIAKEGYSYEEFECLENPPVGEWEDFIECALRDLAADPSLPLAFDIETPYSKGRPEDELEEDPSFTLNCISYAYQGHRGVTQTNDIMYREGHQKLLATPNPKLIWNRPYDLPRVLHNEYKVNGVVRDAMDGAWHYLYSGLKRGLGYATSILQPRFPMWKHLGYVAPEKYSVLDAIALWRNYHTSIRLLKERYAFEGYKIFVEDTDTPLQYMTSVGLPVDIEARVALREELVTLKEASLKTMNAVVPQEVKPLSVYKTLRGIPEGATTEIVRGTKKVTVCSRCGQEGVKKPHVTKKTIDSVPSLW